MCLCLCEILNLYTDILRLDVCYIEIMLRHFHRYVQVRGRTGPESINNSDQKATDQTLRPPPPLHMESPLKSAAETLMYQMSQKV